MFSAEPGSAKRRMKLALIRRHFSSTGGAELYLQRLLAALAKLNHSVTLLTESWEKPPAESRVVNLSAAGSRAQKPVRFADAVDEFLRGEKFDCVFSLERTRRQDVYRAGDGVHRAWLEQRKKFAPWWKKPFIGRGAFHRNMLDLESETFSPSNTGRIIVNSEMVQRELVQYFQYPAGRITLVRNGIDVARFQSASRTDARKRWGFADDDFVLLFCGSGWERKGLKYLIAALPDSPKIKLLVVGKGRPPQATSTRIVFAGSMPDVENAYAAADLFALPAIYEPSANVVFEAMAAGLPVITSASNGAAELIREGVDGTVIANPADVAALSRAIEFWRERRSMPRPRCDLSSLSIERNVTETLAVLEVAASQRGSSR